MAKGLMGKGALNEMIKAYAKRYVDGQSVTVLPIMGDKAVINRQYRRASNTWNYELPGGKLEGHEDPKAAALRELKEETGFRAGRLRLMFAAYPISGINSKKSYFYLATGLRKGKPKRERNERIATKTFGIAALMKMAKNGSVSDAKSIACILYYSSFIRKPARKA